MDATVFPAEAGGADRTDRSHAGHGRDPTRTAHAGHRRRRGLPTGAPTRCHPKERWGATRPTAPWCGTHDDSRLRPRTARANRQHRGPIAGATDSESCFPTGSWGYIRTRFLN